MSDVVKRGLLLGITLVSGAGWIGALSAGEARLEQVMVSAKGYESDPLETPAATLVLERDELLRRNAHNLGEALRGQPGLAVASDGAQGQNPVIRGLKKESVVMLVDGMRLNSAQPAGAIASFLSLGLADRVEVVKGPASVLYGTGALGGVVNVILPQARFDSGHEAQLASSYESVNSSARATGVVRSGQGDHALMLGASLARIGDYRSPDEKVDRSAYDSDSFIGQYRYRLTPGQHLRLSLQQHTDTDVWYPGSTKPHPHPQVQSTTVHSPKTERQLFELGYGMESSADVPLGFDMRLYRQTMARQIFSRANGPLGENIAETRVSFDTDGLDMRAEWSANEQHLLSIGVNAWRMEASPERHLRNMTSPPDFPFVRNDPFKDARIEAVGLFVQDDMQFGALNVLAGLRHDTVKGSAAAVGNPPVTTNLDRSDSALSGSLGLIYQVSPLLRPYASVSRGFRAGEMRERYEASPRGDGYFYVGNPQIKPEIANQIELGLKGDDGRLSYAMSAYRNRINDYISGRVTGATHPSGAPIKATENIGSVTISGVEAELGWELMPGQRLLLTYSRLRGENDDLNEPLFQMPADELGLGWQGRVTQGWSADLQLRHVAKQDRVADIFSNGSEQTTPGYTTADIGATWDWRMQRVRLAVKNLANKHYHEHLSEGAIPAPGRSLMVAWQGNF